MISVITTSSVLRTQLKEHFPVANDLAEVVLEYLYGSVAIALSRKPLALNKLDLPRDVDVIRQQGDDVYFLSLKTHSLIIVNLLRRDSTTLRIIENGRPYSSLCWNSNGPVAVSDAPKSWPFPMARTGEYIYAVSVETDDGPCGLKNALVQWQINNAKGELTLVKNYKLTPPEKVFRSVTSLEFLSELNLLAVTYFSGHITLLTESLHAANPFPTNVSNPLALKPLSIQVTKQAATYLIAGMTDHAVCTIHSEGMIKVSDRSAQSFIPADYETLDGMIIRTTHNTATFAPHALKGSEKHLEYSRVIISCCSTTQSGLWIVCRPEDNNAHSELFFYDSSDLFTSQITIKIATTHPISSIHTFGTAVLLYMRPPKVKHKKTVRESYFISQN